MDERLTGVSVFSKQARASQHRKMANVAATATAANMDERAMLLRTEEQVDRTAVSCKRNGVR